MELSPHPLPEVPLSAEALAEAARKLYADMDAELARCLEGVSEVQASHQPAPGEWSAKETSRISSSTSCLPIIFELTWARFGPPLKRPESKP